ncbi:hypothetical protein ACET3Z_013262 [Daucus carota]
MENENRNRESMMPLEKREMPTTKNKKRMLATPKYPTPPPSPRNKKRTRFVKNMEQSSQTSSPSLSESSEYREKKKKTRKKAKLDKRLKKLNKKIHVCGAVKDPQDLRDYVNDNDEQKQQKKFTLTDGSTDVGVTLFDDFAKQFEEAIKNIGSGNKFVIISSAKIGKFQGDVNLTNYPATRFYINPEHPAVKKLQKRAEKNNFLAEKEVIPTQLENVAIDDMSITDIKNLNKEGKVGCKCNECGRFFPWPQKRFRLFVLCTDKTGALPLVLGDGEIRRLTGKMVFDVELDLTEEYGFTILVNEENILKNSEVYEVCDVQINVDESVENATDVQQISEDAEDDQMLDEMHVETETSRNKAKKLPKKAQREKINAGGGKPKQQTSRNKEKIIKIKKVRIIRNWKGVSNSGDAWKGINILLLDDKNFRMHAFVPGKIFEEQETKLKDGNICIISNFTIKEYDTSEKFRCVNHDKQIILTTLRLIN